MGPQRNLAAGSRYVGLLAVCAVLTRVVLLCYSFREGYMLRRTVTYEEVRRRINAVSFVCLLAAPHTV